MVKDDRLDNLVNYNEALKWFVLGYDAAETWEGRAGECIIKKNKFNEKLLKEYSGLWEHEFKKAWNVLRPLPLRTEVKTNG